MWNIYDGWFKEDGASDYFKPKILQMSVIFTTSSRPFKEYVELQSVHIQRNVVFVFLFKTIFT